MPTKFVAYWGADFEEYEDEKFRKAYQVGEVLECRTSDVSEAELREMELISLDESVVQITRYCFLNFVADGVAKVIVRPKYNPAIGRTFTFYVGNVSGPGDDKPDDPGDDKPDDLGDDKPGGDPGDDKPGGGQEDGKPENDGSGNGSQANGQEKKYYDKSTGITISISNRQKKEAVLTKVDHQYATGELTVPDILNVNGTAYKLTAIGKNAFQNQKQLKKAVLGKNIKTIGENAFYGCGQLQTVTLGKNITAIGNKAFYKCIKLQKITIPTKVSKIGKSAFYGCKELKNITIQSKKLTNKNVGRKAFKGIHASATVRTPKSKLSAYKKLLRSKGGGKKLKVKK